MNVVIADCHVLCRDSLAAFIHHADSSFSVAGVADYDELRSVLQENNVRLAIVDADLPGLSDIASIRSLMEDHPLTRFAILTSDSKNKSVLSKMNVFGIFNREMSCKSFLGGIQDIVSGKAFFAPVVAMQERDIPSFSKAIRKNEYNLSKREREVLSYVAKGDANKDIARVLDLQVVTVKLHVRGICRKLAVKNRTQAAMLAMEKGLV